MGSRFDIILDVSDKDFRGKLPELHEQCVNLDSKLDGSLIDWKQCIQLVRPQGELLISYLYVRLMGKQPSTSKEGKFFAILDDKQFQAKINNSTFIDRAHSVRRYGNKYIHNLETQNADFHEEASLAMDHLFYLVDKACSFIRDNPLRNFPYSTHDIKIAYSRRKRDGAAMLTVSISGVPSKSLDEFEYVWKIDRTGEEIGKKSRVLKLIPDWAGKIISCTVSRSSLYDGYVKIVSPKAYSIEEINASVNSPSPSQKAAPKPISQAQPDSEPALRSKPEHAPTAVSLPAPEPRVGHKPQTASNVTGASGVQHTANTGSLSEEMLDIPSAGDTSTQLLLSLGKHDGQPVIWAKNGDELFPKGIAFTWKVHKSNGSVYSMEYKGSHLSLKDLSSGDEVICEAVFGDGTAPSTASIILKSEDFEKSDTVAPKTEPKPQDESATRTNLCSQSPLPVVTIPKPLKEPAHKASESAPACPIPPIKQAYVHADSLPPRKRLFDAADGLIHYFVRPNDVFVTASLEMLDANAYLYRLLKQDGFDRVAFVEIKNDSSCAFNYYDALSEGIYKPEKDASKAGTTQPLSTTPKLSGGMSSRKKETSASDSSSPATVGAEPTIGFRTGQIVTSPEEFVKQVKNEIHDALSGRTLSSAIVMPLSILKKGGYFGDSVWESVRAIQENNSFTNILVFTLPNKEDLIDCVEGSYPQLHTWAKSIISDNNEHHNINIVNESIARLEEKSLLVMADDYRSDEIANLLFRKALFDPSSPLSQISQLKIYPLAEQLLAHCTGKEKIFNEYKLGFSKQPEALIMPLAVRLNRPETAAELVETARDLPDATIVCYSRLSSLYLERVYHQGIVRYQDSSTLEEIMREFDALVGVEMQAVKADIQRYIRRFKRQRDDDDALAAKGKKPPRRYFTMQFLGDPGTGKTTVARLVGRLMRVEGILPTSKYVEIKAGDLLSSHPGDVKNALIKAADEANGGVLFIDEFYSFNSPIQGGNVGEEAVNALMSISDNPAYDICIIIAGYKEQVAQVLKMNKGGPRRFARIIDFPRFSVESLMDIFRYRTGAMGRTLGEGVEPLIEKIIRADLVKAGDTFGNGGYIEELIEQIEDYYDGADTLYTADGIKNTFASKYGHILDDNSNDVSAVWADFDKLVGLEMKGIKGQIEREIKGFKDNIEVAEAARAKGEKPDSPFMNMQFLGDPGTGKTTVAKLVGRLLCAEGILPNNKVVETTAQSLVSGQVGATAENLRRIADSARGGVLFIDEFYGFNSPHSTGNTGNEAMGALVGITNDETNKMCIIAAGYEDEVQSVLQMNSGLASRFPIRVNFTPYSVDTLMEIFHSILKKRGKTLEAAAEPIVRRVMESKRNEKDFGNGRAVNQMVIDIRNRYLDRDGDDDIYRVRDVQLAFGLVPDVESGKEADGSLEAGSEGKAGADTPNTRGSSSSGTLLPKSLILNLDPPYALEPKEKGALVRETRPAVLFIKTDKGTGTGFVIHPAGYAATCEHVIKGASWIKARLSVPSGVHSNEKWFKCSVRSAREDIDMAILKLEDDGSFPYLPLATRDRTIGELEDIVINGFPLGELTKEETTPFPGSVSSKQLDNIGLDIYMLSCEGHHGCSGGPVISLVDGRVIGIFPGAVRKKGDSTEGINFMRPIWHLIEELLD